MRTLRNIMNSAHLAFFEKAFMAFARYCLRHSIRIQETVERLKSALVRVAIEEIQRQGEKPSTSKISVMTGLHRRDVERLASGEPLYDGRDSVPERIVGVWQHSKRFTNVKRKPRPLSRSEFDKLVEGVSRELSPSTVLFELKRSGVVEVRGEKFHLSRMTYSPSDKVEHGLAILSSDLNDMIEAVDENLSKITDIPNLHARTEFDNVRPEQLAEMRAFLVREGHEFHRKVRNFISQQDQDISPDPNFSGQGVKVVVGSFSRIQRGDK